MVITITGQSGTRWVVDQREDATLARRGTPFLGWEEGNEQRRVWVQRVLGGEEGDIFDEDRRHLRRAYEVGQLPAIASSPSLRRVLDIAEPFDLYLVQELADAVRDDVVASVPLPPGDRRELGRCLRDALSTIHAAGLVHSDVQTSNVLRVAGTWKLADLGAVVPIGAEIKWSPRDRRFVLPQLDEESVAVPQMDWWGAAEVLRDAGASDEEIKEALPAFR